MRWRKTKVNIDNHIIVPDINLGSIESPDRFVEDYVARLTGTPDGPLQAAVGDPSPRSPDLRCCRSHNKPLPPLHRRRRLSHVYPLRFIAPVGKASTGLGPDAPVAKDGSAGSEGILEILGKSGGFLEYVRRDILLHDDGSVPEGHQDAGERPARGRARSEAVRAPDVGPGGHKAGEKCYERGALLFSQ